MKSEKGITLRLPIYHTSDNKDVVVFKKLQFASLEELKQALNDGGVAAFNDFDEEFIQYKFYMDKIA